MHEMAACTLLSERAPARVRKGAKPSAGGACPLQAEGAKIMMCVYYDENYAGVRRGP